MKLIQHALSAFLINTPYTLIIGAVGWWVVVVGLLRAGAPGGDEYKQIIHICVSVAITVPIGIQLIRGE